MKKFDSHTKTKYKTKNKTVNEQNSITYYNFSS